MNYWQLLKQYPAFLMFGFIATFASSFGQTFFISLFVDDITHLHHLSYGQFGSLYAITTAVGGLFLMRVGKKLDYIALKKFAHFTVLGLAISAALMALSANWLVLIVAMFGLRLFGQGLMGHMAVTSMGRYFNELRGRAVAFSGIGFPAGEIVLPGVALFLLSHFGFINTWWLITGIILVAFWPLLIILQGHHPKVSLAKDNSNTAEVEEELPAMLRQRDLIRDKRFLGVLPSLLALPFVLTGILINQLWFAEQRGWSTEVIAIGIAMFSVSRVITSVIAGSWVDKLGSFKLIGVNLLPVALGLVALNFIEAFWGWYLFLFLCGFSAGFNSAISGTLWPEIYGTHSLGTIRALYHSLMIFATAAAPMLFGYLIDLKVPLSWWLLTTAAALVLAWLSARLTLSRISRES